MRARRVKDLDRKIKNYGDVIIFHPEEFKGKWKRKFGNDYPLYLEIGSGKGGFLRRNAVISPETNFIGCERSQNIIYKAARESGGIDNLLLINCDAANLANYFDCGEVEKIYLTFCDPWPKKRHGKRRLTSFSFLDVYERILRKGGTIELKTDDPDFFEFSMLNFKARKYEIIRLSHDLHHNGYDRIITTEYEEKFIAEGKKIYFTEVRVNNNE